MRVTYKVACPLAGCVLYVWVFIKGFFYLFNFGQYCPFPILFLFLSDRSFAFAAPSVRLMLTHLISHL